jgi:uncharacterized lipoprotein YehR (DUF1307 family)
MKKLFLLAFTLIALISLSSCKKCLTCEYESGGIEFETTMCYSGLGSKEELDKWEKSLKESYDNVKCSKN